MAVNPDKCLWKWQAGRARRCFVFAFLGLAVALGLPSSGVVAEPGSGRRDTSAVGAESVIHLDEAAALESYLRAVAEVQGWTVEEARTSYLAAEAVGLVNSRIAGERRDQYLGAVISSDDPSAPPELFLKGPADDFVRDLVRSAPIKITIRDGQPYGFYEIQADAEEAFVRLQDMGFDSVATGFRIEEGGRIRATVTERPGMPRDEAMIRANMSTRLMDRVEVAIAHHPVDTPHSAFGGMKIYNSGSTTSCTAGLPVVSGSGVQGVVSAAHCSNRTLIADPVNGSTHQIQFQKQHAGAYGDVEWYRVPEPGAVKDDFIANYTNGSYVVQDIATVKPEGYVLQGMVICLYSRMTGSHGEQKCGVVSIVNQSCWTDVYVGGARQAAHKMVVMDRYLGQPGDSGGTMFTGSAIYGVYHGGCTPTDGGAYINRATFSQAHLLDEALGVWVKTQ